jgi:hypothetical protein
MWSWCGQVDGSEADIQQYLELMNGLERDYPGVTFVYMTGHLDGSGADGNVHRRNEQIRAYTRANSKVLFDFADIETFSPSLDSYLDAGGGCDADGCCYSGGNWCADWIAEPRTDWGSPIAAAGVLLARAQLRHERSAPSGGSGEDRWLGRRRRARLSRMGKARGRGGRVATGSVGPLRPAPDDGEDNPDLLTWGRCRTARSQPAVTAVPPPLLRAAVRAKPVAQTTDAAAPLSISLRLRACETKPVRSITTGDCPTSFDTDPASMATCVAMTIAPCGRQRRGVTFSMAGSSACGSGRGGVRTPRG